MIIETKLNFDITSPQDIQRYKTASEKMEKASKQVARPTVMFDHPDYLNQYLAMISIELKLYADFLDEAFGQGTAQSLLGENPSILKAAEVNARLAIALQNQIKMLEIWYL